MATILYKCDTCKREIAITENTLGMTVFAKCVITEGCKGSLYKLSRNPNIIREDLDFPPVVAGLNDYTPRRAFFEQEINISANPWKIKHDMGVIPSVTVYFFDENTGEPFEVAPDEYVINPIDENNLEISFNIQRRGIAHLIARSSVPREVITVPDDDNLFQVSSLGFMNLSVSSIINTDVGQIFLVADDFDLRIEVQVPSNPVTVSEGTFLVDSLDSTSPWFGFDQILIRKRRNFATKSLQVLDFITAAFPTITSLEDIPDGTSFQIQEIKYRNVGVGFEGEFIAIEPRSLFLLLANEPYQIPDKIRNQLVDVGELLLSDQNRFFVFGGEVFLDRGNLERIYPRIEETTDANLQNTPTPTVTPTPTLTPSVTLSVTPTVTPSTTAAATPVVTPTNTVTPSATAATTPVPSPTAAVTPTVTPTPSPAVTINLNAHTLTTLSEVPFFGGMGESISRIRVRSDGELDETSVAGTSEGVSPGFSANEWHSTNPNGGIGANFDARMTLQSGVINVGNVLGVWLNLGGDKSWGATTGFVANNVVVGQGLLEIRPAGGGATLASALIDFSATVVETA